MANNSEHFAPVLTFLKKFDQYRIFTHITPDGDALGSSFALCELLRQMGKKAAVVLLEPPPAKYAFEQFRDLYVPLEDAGTFEAAVSVDCATAKRLGSAEGLFSEHPNLRIDHHVSGDMYGEINFVEESPATAQIICELYEASGLPMTDTAAAAIYMGIIADTGNLTYSSTTPESFRICADLAQNGLNTSAIAERVFNSRSLAATKLIGVFINNMQLYCENRVAISFLTCAELEDCGVSADETEGLINYARNIDTVEVAAFLREMSPSKFKISLRSKEHFDVARFAAHFKGGGHPRAAGCVMYGELDSLRDTLRERIEETLE